jgi:TolB-like protein
LVEANGQAVTKAELMAAAWPGVIVEESNLTVQIATLRKLLGSTPDGHDWIITVPRLGYRMILPSATATNDAAVSVMPSLAVLPFENLSGNSELEYFSDGVVQDIITALSRFKRFAVIARNSSFAFKGRAVDVREIASQLGVRYVLQGSFRWDGEFLRITAQLIDGRTGTQHWAQSYDGTRHEVFDFQERLTESVVAVVEPQIHKAELRHSLRERRGSVATYDLLLRARANLDAESKVENAQASAILEEVMKLEPNNALAIAYAGYALEHAATMGWIVPGPDFQQQCTALARRGLLLAEGDATVMVLCAMTLIFGAKEYDWGMASMQAALDINPNNMLVVIRAGAGHINCGNLDDALMCMQRALRLSPRDPNAFFPLTGIAHVEIVRGNYAEALYWSSKALALNPNFGPTLWITTAANAHLGRMVEARRFLKQLQSVSPDVTIAKLRVANPNKDESRMVAILEGLRLAGLSEA